MRLQNSLINQIFNLLIVIIGISNKIVHIATVIKSTNRLFRKGSVNTGYFGKQNNIDRKWRKTRVGLKHLARNTGINHHFLGIVTRPGEDQYKLMIVVQLNAIGTVGTDAIIAKRTAIANHLDHRPVNRPLLHPHRALQGEAVTALSHTQHSQTVKQDQREKYRSY